ncbi:ABC transporter ATP-binding protein [Rhodococcus sp. SJ-2]
MSHEFFMQQNGGNGSDSTTESQDKVLALKEVDLQIEKGEFVALVGASGCGKTTLLNMVAGFISPTHGTVSINGAVPTVPNLELGYMFARDALLPWRTAAGNVSLPLEARGIGKNERRSSAAEWLSLVGLSGRENAFPNQLSQGMRQRVALARTFAANPSLLLMDEPFAALDARTKLTLQSEFCRIWECQDEESRQTVVFVTHDLQEAALLADRVVVMLPSPGRVADVIPSRIPRPRAADLRGIMLSGEFQETVREMFDSLEGAMG